MDFLAKANLFNDFFSKQYSTIVNTSSLPTNLIFETENRLSTFDFSTGNIIKFNKTLDPIKALMGMLEYLSSRFNCVSLQYQNLCIFFLRSVWKTNASPING